jgi:streptogramin lyase
MPVLSSVAKRLGDLGRRRRATVRKPPRHRLALEALDDRILLSAITEFPTPTADSQPFGITRGPDGNLWFTESLTGKIGRITPAGVITEFAAGITPGGQPLDITAGPDGNLWFTEQSITETTERIGRITPAGVITEFAAGITPNFQPRGITAGPDGNLWFTEESPPNGPIGLAGRIGRITPAGVITEFAAGLTPNTDLNLITAGPDGNLWFGQSGNSAQVPGEIGRITPAGVITEFSAGLNAEVAGITTGPDGNLWFTEDTFHEIGRITPAGVVTQVAITSTGEPRFITTGPDGNLWFTEPGNGRIGRLTPAGALTEFASGITSTSFLGAVPSGIAVGPDGNIWFAELGSDRIGRLNLAQATPDTTTTLRTSAATAVFGQTEVLTATVTAPAGVVPTGVVNFYDGDTFLGFLGNAVLDNAGQATLSVSLGVGNHALTATYFGNLPSSTSATVTETVNRAATAVALSPSSNPVATGKSVTFTATVTAVAPGAGTPAGTVTFFDGTIVLGTVALNASGKAALTTSFATAGSHTIKAVYHGNGNFLASSRQITEQVVVPRPSTTTLVASANPVPTGQPVTFTATVGAASGTGTPTGTITFMDGTVVLARVALKGGKASLTRSFSTKGSHLIKAIYSGDSLFAASVQSLTEQVG